ATGNACEFLAKFDSTGAVVYANRYGGDGFDLDSPTLAVDDAGNAYFGGACLSSRNGTRSPPASTASSAALATCDRD
ncbi:MAG TPA: hypothetical protein VF550_12820, partial [Polyangia bacterium]